MDREVPERVRQYLRHGLSATPKTMAALLRGASDAEFDARPYADRFTLREVLGHVADWDGIWLERLIKIATEDAPLLPGYDEGQWAIDHDYAHMEPAEQLARFAADRQKLVDYLAGVETGVWQRSGTHSEMGSITFLELVSLVLGHDGYHVRQILDYRGMSEPVGA